MSKQSIARDLDRAAHYMTKHGQARGKFVTIGGRVCAVGALRKAAGCGRANRAWKHMDRRCATLFGGIGDPDVPVGLTGVNDAKLTHIPTLFHKEAARLRGNARRGVRHQQRKAEQQAKKAEAINTARQHTSAAPIKALGAALVMLLVAGTVLRVAWPLLAAFLTTLLSYLLVLGEAVGLTAATIAMAAVIHWATKARRVRVEQRASLEARQAEVLEAIEERAQLFALPAGNTVADDVLKQAWTESATEKEAVPR